VVPASEKDPEGWGSTDKFSVVLESAGLNATERSAYCRERGLFPEQVKRWRQKSHRFGEQLLSGVTPGRAVPSPWARPVCPRSALHSASRRMGQTGDGAGTSAFCRPQCGVCGCTSTWWSTSGAARWWPGMWLRWSRLRSPPIWCSGPVSCSANAAPAARAATTATSRHSPSMPATAMPNRRLLEELRGPTLESRLEEMGVL